MEFTFDDDLTPEQEAAIAALITNASIAKAAEQAGIGERTLYRYLKDDKFRAAYRGARRQVFAQAISLSQRYTPVAVNVLAKVMTDPLSANASKVAAAAAVMRFGARASNSMTSSSGSRSSKAGWATSPRRSGGEARHTTGADRTLPTLGAGGRSPASLLLLRRDRSRYWPRPHPGLHTAPATRRPRHDHLPDVPARVAGVPQP